MYIELERTEKARYYVVEKRPNLLGGYSVWLTWGGIGKRPSRIIEKRFNSSSRARREAVQDIRRKRKDGYK